MKILQVHNVYIGKTGEEAVVEEERRVLQKKGHEVIQFIKDNSDLGAYSKLQRLKMYLSLHSSDVMAVELEALIVQEQPDVCHVHNTFPLITPIVYKVCRSLGLPVVQTLHNYKMVCTNSLLFRDGEVCEKCLNKSLYNSIKYKCYRGSYLATAAQASVIQHHRNSGTWNHMIDRYICLTEFQRDKVVSGGGVPEIKTVIKPNFLSGNISETVREDFFLFVGRVNDSKGLQDLLYLFQRNTKSNFVVIGKSDDDHIFQGFENVDYLGEQDREVVLDHMQRCKAVIFPSKYYEGMPIVILEAFSHSKPVISRNTGAMTSMIEHKVNGLKYENEESLVEAVDLMESSPQLTAQLGDQAYEVYLEKYSEEIGYQNLINVYSGVLNERSPKI